MTHPITTYLNSIKDKLATGQATEHTHRPALADLFEALGENIKAINEPTRAAWHIPMPAANSKPKQTDAPTFRNSSPTFYPTRLNPLPPRASWLSAWLA